MFRAYFILNIILATAAVAATTWLFVGEEPERQITDIEESTGSTQDKAPGYPNVPSPRTRQIEKEDVEVLWKKVIFNPNRREGIGLDTPIESEEERTALNNMELMAVGMMGSRAAAIIRVEAQRTPRSAGRRSGNNTSSGGKNVYELGEIIENTGYTISEIKMEEVVLNRGDEERVLRLNPSSKSSERRRTAAVKARQAADRNMRRQNRLAALNQSNAESDGQGVNVPQKPPIPGIETEDGTESTKGGGDSESMTREEQIRKTIERRRKIIEELRRRQQEQ